MDKRIVRFLKKHHVCTLATCCDGQPWCASVFYLFMEEEMALVFTSDTATRHITEGLRNQKVAGAIPLETEMVGLIRGVQFSGVLLQPELELKKKALRAFLMRFPYAVLRSTSVWRSMPVWVVDLYEIKFTDNRLGFGKKLTWSRNNSTNFSNP